MQRIRAKPQARMSLTFKQVLEMILKFLGGVKNPPNPFFKREHRASPAEKT